MNVVYLIVCVTVIEDDSSDDCDIDCGFRVIKTSDTVSDRKCCYS